ncbi:hypothetical protein [Nostoc sp.]|uniref:hypothetical protein n=1 Tax=Nostoc sp. TaxID=1180 RepID=UPI002FF94641
MTIRLTETNFKELCNDVQLNHYQGKVKFSTWFNQVSSHWTMLRHRLELVIQESDYSEAVIVEGEHDNSPFLTSKFYLSGGMRTTTPNVPGVSDDYEEVAGYNYLFYLPDIREFEHFTANQHKQCISIYWYPDLLSTFRGSFKELPTLLLQLSENPTKERFHQPLGAIMPAMRLVLRQILQCPFRETLRQMYIVAIAVFFLFFCCCCHTTNSGKRSN